MLGRMKTLLTLVLVPLVVVCAAWFASRGLGRTALAATGSSGKAPAEPYRNPRLPVEKRVRDLLGRMTLAEKVAQLQSVNWSGTRVFDGKGGRFSPEKARALMPHGIGHITRPGDQHDAAGAAELANAIQKFLVEETRLGIPAILHEEGLHGFVGPGATSFPQAIALAATFDPALVEEVFTVAARQMRSRGVAQVLAPVLDVSRDARWGRIEETYGEDPYLVSRLGVAAVMGFQGRRNSADAPIDGVHVLATAKHLTGHGQPEGGRNTAPALVGPRSLREIFFPPFEAAIREAHIESVMPSYNEIDGVPSHANRWMLSDVLRNEWGFRGVVVSDYFAIAELARKHHLVDDVAVAGRTALLAGVDIELPEPDAYKTLQADATARRLDETIIDQAVARGLRAKFLLGLFEHPLVEAIPPESERASDRELARRAAQRAMVLLKNDGVLPLDSSKLRSIAVIGPNADACRLGGYSGTPDKTVSVLQGIRERLQGKVKVLSAQGCGLTLGNRGWVDDEIKLPSPAEDAALVAEAKRVAAQADLTVLVLGENEQLSREAWAPTHLGDRGSLDLVGAQMDLARALLASGRPTVVVLLHGGPLAISELAAKASAILDGFYLGEETGHAVADVLFGDVSPAGRLPVSVPRSVGAVPAFYNRKPSADRLHLFEEAGPLWPFGHGLSYTTFAYDPLTVTSSRIPPTGHARVSVTVTNTGQRASDEVVQLYLHDLVASVTRPIKELKGFRRIHLAPGQSTRVDFDLGPDELALWNAQMKRVVEPGAFEIMVGASSADIRQTAMLNVTP
jgi:beta-glucosidase